MGIKDQFQEKAERMQQQGRQKADQARGQAQDRARRRDDDAEGMDQPRRQEPSDRARRDREV
ncbi:hypothetical protein AB0E75_08395 [Streptomyces griseoviridis]|jgi:hypothetical protein|uniref:Uncharacterized protein n=1 Tax=Streptomyces griseoviridis TaxID=45398 RepID=A0A918LCL7_STRGD|nr:hypothetical protein [Streptomyces niveoruber]GGS30061.1 hypothetical protein GCM10010238_18840 [Streptomyces niveoruber]